MVLAMGTVVDVLSPDNAMGVPSELGSAQDTAFAISLSECNNGSSIVDCSCCLGYNSCITGPVTLAVDASSTAQLVVSPARLNSAVLLSVELIYTKFPRTVRIVVVPSTGTSCDMFTLPTSAVYVVVVLGSDNTAVEPSIPVAVVDFEIIMVSRVSYVNIIFWVKRRYMVSRCLAPYHQT